MLNRSRLWALAALVFAACTGQQAGNVPDTADTVRTAGQGAEGPERPAADSDTAVDRSKLLQRGAALRLAQAERARSPEAADSVAVAVSLSDSIPIDEGDPYPAEPAGGAREAGPPVVWERVPAATRRAALRYQRRPRVADSVITDIDTVARADTVPLADTSVTTQPTSRDSADVAPDSGGAGTGDTVTLSAYRIGTTGRTDSLFRRRLVIRPRLEIDTTWGPAPVAADSTTPDTSVAVFAALRDTSADPVLPPRVRVNVAVPIPKRVTRVASGGGLQSAINAAQPGDEIRLAMGATWTGTYKLPKRSGYVVIRAEGPTVPFGVRMTPEKAAAVRAPVIQSTTSEPAIRVDTGGSYWRLIGLDITCTATNGGCVRMGGGAAQGQTTLAKVPHHLIIDRSSIRIPGSVQTKRCLEWNASDVAVISSSLVGCKNIGAQVQGIALWNTPCRARLENNYIEGSGQNMIIGGADPAIPNVNCTDVEIRDNLFYKPPTWKGVYLVANNWETKSSSRVWLQGNVFDGSWPDAQIGFVWNWKTANQSGGCNWCQSSHLTAVYNVLQNGAMGMQLTGCETYGRVGATCVNTNHVRVSRNVFRQISTPGAAGFSSSARNMMIGQVGAAAISDNVFDKATPTTGTFYHAFMFSTTVVGPLRIVGNAVDSATYFTKDVTTMAPGAVVTRNASPKSGMVSGNVQTKTLAEAETRAAVGVRAAVDSATRRARTGLPR